MSSDNVGSQPKAADEELSSFANDFTRRASILPNTIISQEEPISNTPNDDESDSEPDEASGQAFQ